MKSGVKAATKRRARNCCEYCQIPLRFDIFSGHVDHIIAQQHGGKSTLDNLAWSCSHCNAHKGTNLAGIDPETTQMIRMFNPRRDRWNDHFRWIGPRLVGLTPEGRTTIRVLAINKALRMLARQSLMDEGRYQ